MKKWLANPYIRYGLNFIGGAAIGLFLNYYLYRIGLPLKPFIYQAF